METYIFKDKPLRVYIPMKNRIYFDGKIYGQVSIMDDALKTIEYGAMNITELLPKLYKPKLLHSLLIRIEFWVKSKKYTKIIYG